MDTTNIRKFTLRNLDENGKVTYQTLYLNIDTLLLVPANLINGMEVTDLDIVCANLC